MKTKDNSRELKLKKSTLSSGTMTGIVPKAKVTINRIKSVGPKSGFLKESSNLRK